MKYPNKRVAKCIVELFETTTDIKASVVYAWDDVCVHGYCFEPKETWEDEFWLIVNMMAPRVIDGNCSVSVVFPNGILEFDTEENTND